MNTVPFPYDIVLSGGTVIDPATGLNGRYDVAIAGGKIAAIEPDLSQAPAREKIDVTGKIVTAGMIDTHAHVYEHVTGRFGLNPDMVGVRSGVTTLIDQGGPSCMTIGGFRHYLVETVEEPPALLHLLLSGRRPRRPSLSGPLRPDRRERRAHRARRQGKPRYRARHQGPCRDRRPVALGPRRHQDRPRHRRPDRPAALHPSGPVVAEPRRRPGAGRRRTDPRTGADHEAGRRAGASVHPPSRRLRLQGRRRASDRVRGDRARRAGRCRPRLAFQLRGRQARARRRRAAVHARRRPARLQCQSAVRPAWTRTCARKTRSSASRRSA